MGLGLPDEEDSALEDNEDTLGSLVEELPLLPLEVEASDLVSNSASASSFTSSDIIDTLIRVGSTPTDL